MGPYELLEKLVEVFERLSIPYLVTGSIAAMAYGEPRLTNDIDVVADLQITNIPDLLAAFPTSEFYLSEDAMAEALKRQGQFNIIHPASGLKIDIMIRKETAFNRSRFSRGRTIKFSESADATFAAPEDVILKKMEFYKEGGSEKHLRDITGILKISSGDIDEAYIAEWATRLNLNTIWAAVKKRVNEGG